MGDSSNLCAVQHLSGQGAQQLMDSVLARGGMLLRMSISPVEQQGLDSNGLVPCSFISWVLFTFLFFLWAPMSSN